VGGHGYGITNYFKIRSELGTGADLNKLIQTAHHYGIKVMLDMVPNHSYIDHPYARNSVEYGTDSHYYDFYQRDVSFNPSVPYSEFYHPHPEGFVYYFWEDLPNLNYDNAEVQRWMIEICKYWIEQFDIDGYRFDAVWGVNARKPDFTRQLRLALKRIKPEILMLAEDKATSSMVFEEQFDVAFDWARDPYWVSKWSWQTEYNDWWEDKNYTIFNSAWHADNLKYAINNYGLGYSPNAKILRFMENNDLHRFIRHHGLERTKMIAALMFALHGIPLIYNGQEIGFSQAHPYSTKYIFERHLPIKDQDPYGLFQYYQRLIQLRKIFLRFIMKIFKRSMLFHQMLHTLSGGGWESKIFFA
jgi:glycosidase